MIDSYYLTHVFLPRLSHYVASQHIKEVLGALFVARKIIHYLFDAWIEISVPQYDHLASFGKLCDGKSNHQD